MTISKRKNYSIEFKREAIILGEKIGNRKAANHFGVDESMVRRWQNLKNDFDELPNKTIKTKKSKLAFIRR